jgi:hypothetical protein
LKMIHRVITIVLRILATLPVGATFAVVGFILGANLFIMLGLELFGARGYESGGPIGFLLGALIGLIGSGALLFRRRTGT